MTKLVHKFTDMTAILINTPFESEIPKKADVKRLLAVDDVFYYKRNGPYSDDINKIEKALYIAENPVISNDQYPHYATKSTCLIVTNANVTHGSFMKLKHANKVVDGFNLNQQSWIDLDTLLEKYSLAASVYFSYPSWIRNAVRNAEKFVENGIVDSSVTNLNFQAMHEEQKTYGSHALHTLHSQISSWVTNNRWQ